MKRKSFLSPLAPLLLGILSISGEAQEVKRESLGPLSRFDPNAVEIPGVIAIYGDPRIGNAGGAYGRLQRLADQNKWFLDSGNGIQIMAVGEKTGQIETKEFIKASGAWVVSPSGNLIFAGRRDPANRPGFGMTYECFDFESGKSRWAISENNQLFDARFTPDEKQLVVLHGKRDANQDTLDPFVSWYDVDTGEAARSIKLPVEFRPLSGGATDFLAFGRGGVYVTGPSIAPTCHLIRDGADSSEEVDIGDLGGETPLHVRTGGKAREFVAIYSDLKVLLRREVDGELVHLQALETIPDVEWAYDNNVRFSPDGGSVLISTWGKTMVYPTSLPDAPVAKTMKKWADLGEYSRDGKHFVFFDAGGGWIHKTDDWSQILPLSMKDHPVHCCPIEDAGFSTNGKLVLSNDKRQLLLWSEDGRLLAELSSPQEQDDITCVEMQSAVFLPDGIKIIAADGWNFLEWDLNEIAARVKRKPVNTPRVVGKVVFNNDSGHRSKPVLMNVSLVADGKHLITGCGPVVRYWPIGSKELPPALKIPRSDIMMQPRVFHKVSEDSGIILHSASSTFRLNPDAQTAPESLDGSVLGVDSVQGKAIRNPYSRDGAKVERAPLTKDGKSEESVALPAGWDIMGTRWVSISPDGNLVVVPCSTQRRDPAIVMIDWTQGKIVYQQELPWAVASCEFSTDASKLVMGAANRAVYVFDVKKMLESGK